VEWPAKRCYVGLVAAGVQEQAEDILFPPLLRNCLTLNYISFSLQNSGPCNSFHCLGHSKNVCDDDDERSDRYLRNLVRWCKIGLLTSQTVKNKFQKSKIVDGCHSVNR